METFFSGRIRKSFFVCLANTKVDFKVHMALILETKGSNLYS